MSNNVSGTVFLVHDRRRDLTINSTRRKHGTVDVKQTAMVAEHGSTAYGGGIQLSQWNNSTFVANSAFTRLITFTMPALAAGTTSFPTGWTPRVATESREDDTTFAKRSWCR